MLGSLQHTSTLTLSHVEAFIFFHWHDALHISKVVHSRHKRKPWPSYQMVPLATTLSDL